MPTLDPAVRALAEGPNFAALTTLFEDGSPQTQVMWVGADDEHVLVNTEVHRAKFANVQRDPRVVVLIWSREDPYRYVEIRGKVVDVVRGEEARTHIDELSRRYRGTDYATEIRSERVILRIAPDRVVRKGV